MTTIVSAPGRVPLFKSARTVIAGTLRSPAAVAGRWGTAQLVVVVVVAALNVIGLAMVLSASSVGSLYQGTGTWYYFFRQGIGIGLGIVVLLVVRAVPYQLWRRAIPFGLATTLVLLIAVLVPGVGVSANGSTRWVGVGPITFQPSELLKLVMLLYTADVIAQRQRELDRPARTLVPVLLVFALFGSLVLLQPDLGTVIVAGGITLGVLFIGGVSLGPLAGSAFVGITLATVLSMTEEYRRARLLAFVDPWADPLNTGYQTIQSMVGIASGGITGVGVGQGRAKWGFLPESHTDFIFAVLAEEMGLVGASLVLGMFLILAAMGVRIALRAPDRFGMLTAMGIVMWLTLQAVVNIGAVVGVMPITGVTLPFVSFGGTSLLVSMAAIGILLNIGRQGAA